MPKIEIKDRFYFTIITIQKQTHIRKRKTICGEVLATHSIQIVPLSPMSTEERKDTITEYTYDCLELDSEEDFCFTEDMDEEECNAFFSTIPSDLRSHKTMENCELEDIMRKKNRRWTIYDLTSTKFLPVSVLSYKKQNSFNLLIILLSAQKN